MRKLEGLLESTVNGQVKHNFAYGTLEGMVSNIAFSLVNPFFGVYAIALGASSLMVGLLTAIPALVNAIVFMPAAGFVEKKESRLPTVRFWAGLHRSLYLVLACIPFMPVAKPAFLVSIVTLMSVPGAISGVAWTAMMGDMFPAEDRGEIFGLRNMFMGITGILGTMVAGRLLDRVPFPGNFSLLFLIAAGFGGWGIVLLSRMREPLIERPVHVQQPARFTSRIKNLLDDKELGSQFKVFCASSFLLWFGFGFLAAMWSIYHVEVLRLSNTVIAGFSVLSGVATVVGSRYFGKMASSRGNVWVLFASMIVVGVFPILYTLSPSVAFLNIMHLVSGFVLGGLNLAVFNLVFAYSKPERSPSATAVFNMLINLASFIAPFLGDACYKRFGVYVTFYVGAGFRILALIPLARLVEFPHFTGRPGMKRFHFRKVGYQKEGRA
ncbi:MAG: MFS transporter [Firmicutes bacterium]|jgi:MFS family permease|nr:MFS transporter [Bacillota bacterium]